jgi:hypothetical protein
MPGASRIHPARIEEQNQPLLDDLDPDYASLGDRLVRRGIDIEKILQGARRFAVVVPSWAIATGGTRFGRFSMPGEPRDVFEKLDDAATVHQLVRCTPAVSLHIPWDEPDDAGSLRAHARERGLGFDAMNSNTFEDQPGQEHSYKFGSLSHTEAAVRRQAIEHNLACIEIGQKLGSSALTVWITDGANFPGQQDFQAGLGRQAHLESGRSCRCINLFPWMLSAYQHESGERLFAVPGPHQAVVTGEPVRLDGSRTLALGDEISSFRWEFDDGRVLEGVRVEKVFTRPGVYSVGLAVETAGGLEDVGFCRVKVYTSDSPEPFLPAIFLTYTLTRELYAGQPVRLRGWLHSAIKIPIWLDFGDGESLPAYHSFREITHTYERPGLYVITATATAGDLPIHHRQKIVVRPRPSSGIDTLAKSRYFVSSSLWSWSRAQAAAARIFGDGSASRARSRGRSSRASAPIRPSAPTAAAFTEVVSSSRQSSTAWCVGPSRGPIPTSARSNATRRRAGAKESGAARAGGAAAAAGPIW